MSYLMNKVKDNDRECDRKEFTEPPKIRKKISKRDVDKRTNTVRKSSNKTKREKELATKLDIMSEMIAKNTKRLADLNMEKFVIKKSFDIIYNSNFKRYKNSNTSGILGHLDILKEYFRGKRQ